MLLKDGHWLRVHLGQHSWSKQAGCIDAAHGRSCNVDLAICVVDGQLLHVCISGLILSFADVCVLLKYHSSCNPAVSLADLARSLADAPSCPADLANLLAAYQEVTSVTVNSTIRPRGRGRGMMVVPYQPGAFKRDGTNANSPGVMASTDSAAEGGGPTVSRAIVGVRHFIC